MFLTSQASKRLGIPKPLPICLLCLDLYDFKHFETLLACFTGGCYVEFNPITPVNYYKNISILNISSLSLLKDIFQLTILKSFIHSE